MIADFFIILLFVLLLSYASNARTSIDAVWKTVGAKEKLVAVRPFVAARSDASKRALFAALWLFETASLFFMTPVYANEH
jgi:hypothetical protein